MLTLEVMIHTHTITDNDDAPTVEFYTTSSTDPESVSSKTVTIKIIGSFR